MKLVRVTAVAIGDLAALAVLAVIVSALVVGSTRQPSSTGPESQGAQPGEVSTLESGGAAQLIASNLVQFAGPIWDIAYDPDADTLWAADLSSGEFVGIDAETGVATRWKLPAIQSDLSVGVFTRTLVDQTGAVWVASNYTLIRLEPDTGQVDHHDLPLKVEGMFPDALDVTSVDSGTWISAVAAADDGLYFTRHNVPAIYRIGTEMVVAEVLRTPDEFAGAQGLAPMADRGFWLLGAPEHGSHLGRIDPLGQLSDRRPVDAVRMLVLEGTVVLVGGADNGRQPAFSDSSDSLIVNADRTSAYALAIPNATGGVDVYDDIVGTIRRFSSDRLTWTIELPSDQLGDTISGPVPIGLDPNGAVNPGTVAKQRLTALASDRHGQLWFIVAGANTLARVNP